MTVEMIWLKQMGSESYDSSHGIVTDGEGIYVVGNTAGVMQADVNPQAIRHLGDTDAWVAKFDAETGDQVWLKQLGTPKQDTLLDIAIDQLGGIYVAGTTAGAMPGGDGHFGECDAWVAKFDIQTGGQEWLKQMGTAYYDSAHGISTDDEGGIYVTGSTSGAMAEGSQNQGDEDAWIAKLDANTGEQKWLKQIGGEEDDYAHGVATDAHGHVFVTGFTFGKMQEGLERQGRIDAWVAKFDATVGETHWLKQVGSEEDDYAYCIATDEQNGIYITGRTYGALNQGEQGQGGYDAWVAKFAADTGEQLWLKQLGSVDDDYAYAITTNQTGDVYIAGGTYGTMPEVPDNQGKADAWIAKFDGQTGERYWLKQLGTIESEGTYGIAIDNKGGIYITGNTAGVMPEGEGNQGDYDAWIAKFQES